MKKVQDNRWIRLDHTTLSLDVFGALVRHSFGNVSDLQGNGSLSVRRLGRPVGHHRHLMRQVQWTSLKGESLPGDPHQKVGLWWGVKYCTV